MPVYLVLIFKLFVTATATPIIYNWFHYSTSLFERLKLQCLFSTISLFILPNLRGERERSRALGTKGNNLSIPVEHCTFFRISQENKNILQLVALATFVEARDGYAIKHSGFGWIANSAKFFNKLE